MGRKESNQTKLLQTVETLQNFQENINMLIENLSLNHLILNNGCKHLASVVHCVLVLTFYRVARPRGYKSFLCSTQLGMKFISS